jgi:hypothetical protein
VGFGEVNECFVGYYSLRSLGVPIVQRIRRSANIMSTHGPTLVDTTSVWLRSGQEPLLDEHNLDRVYDRVYFGDCRNRIGS